MRKPDWLARLQASRTAPQLRWLAALGVAAVALTVRFWPLVTGQTLLFGDNYSLMVPGKLFMAEWLRRGIVPLWNPYSLGGLSLVGDINQSLWYPSTLLFVWFSPATALNLVILSHELIAFIGMFGLSWWWLQHLAGEQSSEQSERERQNHPRPSRSITKAASQAAATQRLVVRPLMGEEQTRFWLACLAGILWMFSPQVSGAINNIATTQSIVWLPAIVWAGMWLQTAQTKLQTWLRVGLTSALLTIQLAGGYPQHVLFSGLAAVGISLLTTKQVWRSRQALLLFVVRWALVVGLLFGMSALWWLPFQHTLAQSTRTIQSSAQAGAGSLHPADLVKMVAPYFFDNPVLGMKWGPQWNSMPNVSLYVGWLPLVMLGLLALKGKWTKLDVVMGGSVVATILFAFGDRLPLLHLLQELSSIFRFSRGPSTILMVTTVVLILWLVSRLQFFQSVLTQTDQRRTSVGFRAGLVGWWQQLLNWLTQQADYVWMGLCILMAGTFLMIWRDPAGWWQVLGKLSGGAIERSPFHTMAKDQVIGMSITSNLALNAGLLWMSWRTLKRKWWPGVVAILAIELMINTQGLFFFAPTAVYPTVQQLRHSEVGQLTQQLPIGNRVLIRNYNAPYTDFGAYWEALAVRSPFSDSYVDAVEMKEYRQLRRLAMGLTPAWNVPAGVQSLTGYTTLLPVTINQVFGNQNQVAINNLPPISLTHPQLADWGVGYYLVDTAFQVQEDLSQLKLIGQKGSWQLYALPTSANRFQWPDGSPAIVTNLQETPNQLSFDLSVSASQSALVVADRYDAGWMAEVNGVPVSITEQAGRRQIAVLPGMQQIILKYQPPQLKQGGLISVATIFVWLIGWGWLRLPGKSKRPAG